MLDILNGVPLEVYQLLKATERLLTRGLQKMHEVTITLDMMDVFTYLLVCYITTAVIQDRFSIMTVQVLMLLFVGVLF